MLVCPPVAIVTPEIEVTRAEPGLETDFTIPISGLTAMAGKDARKTEVRGLTSNNLTRSITLRFSGTSLPENENLFCYQLTKASIEIRPLSRIYVASEYPEKSCAWNAIMEHEKRHVVSFIDAIWRYRSQVRDSVWASVWRLDVAGPFTQEEFASYSADLRAGIDKNLATHDRNLLARDQGLQEKIDNSGEYENVARRVKACLAGGK